MNLWRLFLLTVLGATVVTGFYGLSTADDEDKGKEKESVVSLKDVPDKVKATLLVELLREVKGLELEEIEREKEDGKVVYEAEFEYRDTEIVLEVDANGKLLSKEVSREDDDDDGDDDDDDDDDDKGKNEKDDD